MAEQVGDARRRPADELTAKGVLTSPEWQAAFRDVPRHAFVPRALTCWPPVDGETNGPFDRDVDRERWLRVVYSDRLLMVADDGERESSSSMPSRMARFLELLDVRDGNSVLEIGTGTGYNAALMSHRVGAERVTSIDIDAELVAAAGTALAKIGMTPTLAVADGYYGYPARQPYDRIVATCSVPRIPDAWLDQLALDGVVVTPLTNYLLVALHRQADGALVGWAESAGFMHLRSPALAEEDEVELAPGEVEERPLDEWFEWFLSRPSTVPNLYVGLCHPDVRFRGRWDDDDQERLMVGRSDGAWARLRRNERGHTVLQCGPRRLWDLYEATIREWVDLGRPFWDRYGMTVTTDRRQYIWLDDPDSGHRWDVTAAM